jgi:hypothetical protein
MVATLAEQDVEFDILVQLQTDPLFARLSHHRFHPRPEL